MNLVIVESPAKCSKIQGFLGQGYKVIASFGHIRQLKEDLESVGIDKDFQGSWEFMKEKAKAILQIKEAAKSANRIYLASDDDREGELIAYSVCLLLKLDPSTTPRAVFHEITKEAISKAIAHPRVLDMNKVQAAEARTMLDMMVGFTMSPLCWKFIAPSLSAGRCQTPALRLVQEREDEIKSFKPSHSWRIEGKWIKLNSKGEPWSASLMDELEDEESAMNYLENHATEAGGQVVKAETKPWTESAPQPFITSTLQQQASSLYRMKPKDTMRIAQKLYEAGHITYMRTDKAVLSEEAQEAAKKQVKERYGEEYIDFVAPTIETDKPKVKAKAKGKKESDATQEVKAQEAHEAIRPTHMELIRLPATEDWSASDNRLYQAIWLRTLQSVMATCRGNQRTIHFVANGDEDFQWSANWRVTTFEGWKKASTKEMLEQDKEQQLTQEGNTAANAEAEVWKQVSAIQVGDKLQWKQMLAKPHQTKAPTRYTEATLIRELEHKGIGRPSTFASLISTILEKGYVETKTFDAKQEEVCHYELSNLNQWPPTELKHTHMTGGEKDRLTPTPLGTSVLQFLLKEFDDLFKYTFTAEMEARLDAVAEGKEAWKQVLRDTWNQYKDRYQVLKAQKGEVTSSNKRRELGEGYVVLLTKKGSLLLWESPDGDKEKSIFYEWPDGQQFDTICLDDIRDYIEMIKKQKEDQVLGEYQGSSIIKKHGRYGYYVQWNGKTIGCSAEDTFETIVEKLETASSSTVKVVGQFEIRNGPYGLYMFKKDVVGKARKFVSVPSHLSLEEVTEAQLIAVFQHGLQEKARSGAYKVKRIAEGGTNSSNSYRGAGRGGRGGRGGFRGGNRGRA